MLISFAKKMCKSHTYCPYLNSSITLILRVALWEKVVLQGFAPSQFKTTKNISNIFSTKITMHLSQFLPSVIPKRNYRLLCTIILAMNSPKLAKFL